MQIEKLSNASDTKALLHSLGVDSGGVKILQSKMKHHILYIRELHVGGANILKQDALSIGADLAVPRGTVIAKEPFVDCILLGTHKQLKTLARKELAQPFGLKELALKLQEITKAKAPKKREIMGVINANEDSFFQDSRFIGSQAIQRLEEMIEDGASMIDIGGVSSRPNAPVVSEAEELCRLRPILQEIHQQGLYEKVQLSIDSYTPKVISEALENGFHIVNDITGLKNKEVICLCAEYNATAVIMHMQGTPQTMQDNPHYESILEDVYHFFEQRIAQAESLGVKDIIVDVGIGFGKTLENNLCLIQNLEHFLSLDKRILLGASRKSMIDTIHPSTVSERLGGTLALHLEGLRNGASILRVHDVKEHAQALEVFKALSLNHNTFNSIK